VIYLKKQKIIHEKIEEIPASLALPASPVQHKVLFKYILK
jgi:hypothetical protein